MKFTITKETLAKQLQHVSRVVAIRHTLPVLGNVLLETDGDSLRVSGTDLELAVTTSVPANVTQEGSFTVPARTFQEFVSQNPDDEISFDLQSLELVCQSKRVEARIAGLDPDDYPALPTLSKPTTVRFALTPFVEAMKQVTIACATDPSRPVLTGVLVTLKGSEAVFAATDSFRLVERKIAVSPVAKEVQFLLPARAIHEVIRASGAVPVNSELVVSVDAQQALLQLQTVSIYTRLLTGAFPPYQTIIPTTAVAIADVTTAELIQALRLSYVFSQSGVANVLMTITEKGEMVLSTYGSQRGSSSHRLLADLKAGYTPIKVPFNAKYLLDACSATGSQYVQLRFSGITAPLVIATDDLHYLQLVMPIRMDS